MNQVEELEKLRLKIKNITVTMYLITGICAIFSFFIIFNMPIIVIVIGVLITTLVTGKKNKNFKKQYKQIFVARSLEKTLENVIFDPDKGIDRGVISSVGMMRMGDYFYSNDYVKATYNNVGFEQSDVKIEDEYTDKDGNKHRTILFLGKWMIFDFNKSFKADIQVCDKRFTNSTLGGLFSGKKFLNIKLEDIEFNKMFKIHAENEHDAFYILTPHIMESIKNLKNNIKGSILLCFVDNKLHVGLQNGKDSFEASIWKKIDENEINQKLDGEIKEITNFIDQLKLDNDLFRKEVK